MLNASGSCRLPSKPWRGHGKLGKLQVFLLPTEKWPFVNRQVDHSITTPTVFSSRSHGLKAERTRQQHPTEFLAPLMERVSKPP